MKIGTTVVYSIALVALGVGGGWIAGARRAAPVAGEEGHGAHAEEGAKPKLSPQTLANLGVTVAEARLGSFSTYVSVPAVMTELPAASRPLFAPAAGRILEIGFVPGAVATPGALAAAILRDGEPFYEAVWALRRAARAAAILAVQIPGAPASLELAAARGELRRQGCTEEQIARIEKGAEGDAEGRLVQAAAAFLQKGTPIADEALRAGLQAHGFIVDLAVPPASDGGDWDVQAVHARPGERLDAGAPVLTLSDPRRLVLKAEPVGTEMSAMLAALTAGAALEAVPLVAGEAPRLSGLAIARVAADPDAHGSDGYLFVENSPLLVRDEGARGAFRTWRLRAGQRFMIRIPAETFPDVFLLPADAVAQEGAARVVFVEDGDSFRPVEVELLYHDDEVAVVANNAKTELFPGDRTVQSGAFALGLALKAGTQPAAAHHGHTH